MSRRIAVGGGDPARHLRGRVVRLPPPPRRTTRPRRCRAGSPPPTASCRTWRRPRDTTPAARALSPESGTGRRASRRRCAPPDPVLDGLGGARGDPRVLEDEAPLGGHRLARKEALDDVEGLLERRGT